MFVNSAITYLKALGDGVRVTALFFPRKSWVFVFHEAIDVLMKHPIRLHDKGVNNISGILACIRNDTRKILRKHIW